MIEPYRNIVVTKPGAIEEIDIDNRLVWRLARLNTPPGENPKTNFRVNTMPHYERFADQRGYIIGSLVGLIGRPELAHRVVCLAEEGVTSLHQVNGYVVETNVDSPFIEDLVAQ